MSNNWISVKERLPECNCGDYVLVLFKDHKNRRGRGMCVLELVVWGGNRYWENYDGNEDFGFDSVTHWMPLPAPPEEEE